MSETPETPETGPEPTASGERGAELGGPDLGAELETSPLQPAPRPVGVPLAARFADSPMRRLIGAALLAVLALVLVGVTPLRQALVQAFVTPHIAPTATPPLVPTPLPRRAPTVTPTAPGSPAAIEWGGLESRPLHVPPLAPGATCPVSPVQRVPPEGVLGLGSGPVFPYPFTPEGQPLRYDPPRQGANGLVVPGFTELTWAIAPTYTGDVLVRGTQLDGPHPLFFNGGAAQLDLPGDLSEAPLLNELQLVGGAVGSSLNGGWTLYGSFLRMEAPGCYALQIDGSPFSYILVFQAGI